MNIVTITDAQILALQLRNEARMKEAKEKLGSRWVLHKNNAPNKNPDKRILQ